MRACKTINSGWVVNWVHPHISLFALVVVFTFMLVLLWKEALQWNSTINTRVTRVGWQWCLSLATKRQSKTSRKKKTVGRREYINVFGVEREIP